MITCWNSSQKQFYRFSLKTQDRKFKAQCRSPMACRVIIFIPLRVKKGLYVLVASLVLCFFFFHFFSSSSSFFLTSSHILMPFKCHLFYMRRLVETWVNSNQNHYPLQRALVLMHYDTLAGQPPIYLSAS